MLYKWFYEILRAWSAALWRSKGFCLALAKPGAAQHLWRQRLQSLFATAARGQEGTGANLLCWMMPLGKADPFWPPVFKAGPGTNKDAGLKMFT